VFSKSAPLYDLFYAGKDYAREADRLRALVGEHQRSPGTSLLDVACGTGGHIAFLRRDYAVEGLDLDRGLLEIARRKHPDVVFHQGDMLNFDLGRRFDVVVCLFSSIGYVKTPPRLRQAVQTMARHVHPGGLLVIEPWLTPDAFKPGMAHGLFVDQPEIKAARMNVSAVEDGVSIIEFHYLVATATGVDYFTERHELGLFTLAEYEEAMRAAGLEVMLDHEGLMGRGLLIGRQPGS